MVERQLPKDYTCVVQSYDWKFRPNVATHKRSKVPITIEVPLPQDPAKNIIFIGLATRCPPRFQI